MNTESIQLERKKISETLKCRRQEMGISGEELARRVGVTGSTIWRVENSKFWPRMDLLLSICKQLNCQILIK